MTAPKPERPRRVTCTLKGWSEWVLPAVTYMDWCDQRIAELERERDEAVIAGELAVKVLNAAKAELAAAEKREEEFAREVARQVIYDYQTETQNARRFILTELIGAAIAAVRRAEEGK